jgi:hypothetical protein
MTIPTCILEEPGLNLAGASTILTEYFVVFISPPTQLPEQYL